MAERPALVVAMIGLGHMGGPMADNLVDAGFDVRVFDIAEEAVRARVQRGAAAANSVSDATSEADVIGVVVFDDAQALAVIAGPRGVFESMKPSAVVVLHSTVSLETIDYLGRTAVERGAHFLDAGISGGEAGATAGTLVTMVGGEIEAIERARPALEAFSREVVHAGPLGAGMALKLARNAVGYIMMAAGYEALRLTQASGIDAATLRHVLETTDLPTMLYTPFNMGGPAPLPAGIDDGTRDALIHTYRLGYKDLSQALALGGHHGIRLPAVLAARSEFAGCVRLEETTTIESSK